jgi:hypothetical protein
VSASEAARYRFAPTPEEAAVAAARAGVRSALRGRLSLHHAAPLVAFALILLFVAILAFTGLMGRRLAESLLILAAIVFMASRLAAHWGFWSARKRSLAEVGAPDDDGEVVVSLDETGLVLESAAGPRHFDFAACVEAEYAGGMVYLWPRVGAPAFIPARAFESEAAAEVFAALLRERVRSAAGRALPSLAKREKVASR